MLFYLASANAGWKFLSEWKKERAFGPEAIVCVSPTVINWPKGGDIALLQIVRQCSSFFLFLARKLVH